MKSQDLVFFAILFVCMLYKQGKYTHAAGIILLIFAGFLFTLGNLFTSQRLSWYAACLLAVSLVSEIIKSSNKNANSPQE